MVIFQFDLQITGLVAATIPLSLLTGLLFQGRGEEIFVGRWNIGTSVRHRECGRCAWRSVVRSFVGSRFAESSARVALFCLVVRNCILLLMESQAPPAKIFIDHRRCVLGCPAHV